MSLRTQLETAKAAIETLKQTHKDDLAALEVKFEGERTTFNNALSERDETLKSQKKTLEQQRDSINTLELKKFADSFDKQEKQFRQDARTWLNIVGIVSAITVGVTWYAIHITINATGVNWYGRVGYYLIDLVLFTLLAFSLKQYSYYVKLGTDYGNRKTLAQSYFNIYDSADEDDEIIRTQFLDKISTILAAPAMVVEESHTLIEKVIEKLPDNPEFIKFISSLKDKIFK